MSSQQKRGFRLPWAADRGPDEALTPVRLKALTDDADGMAPRPDLARRPVRGAERATPNVTMDAASAASDVPDEEPEATMIDESELPTTDRIERAAGGGAWPTRDREGPDHARDVPRPGARPQLRIAGTPPTRRRENPLVAGLVKAMREAALASRAETTSRVQSEATARVEAIRAESTEGAAALRKQVDDDIATFRDWSKSEMARIRQETEQRIEARREEAIAENKRHLDGVERLVDQVQMTVAAFESDMDRFFGELLAENDPARLAALAEQAPDPPDLAEEGRSSNDDEDDAETPSVEADAETQSVDADAETAPVGLEAADAAEAEAEATEGLDLSSAESLPAAVMAARRADDAGTDPETATTADSRIIVSGLKSVAGISAFKGALGQVPGIRSVSVSSGEKGVFIFAVHHEPDVDLASTVLGLEGFAARINRTTDDGLTVIAHEPAA
jgi:hypothetical protein